MGEVGCSASRERPGEDDFLTSREAASFLGRTPRGMQAMRDRGDGPQFVLMARGGRGAILYRRSAIEAFCAARTMKP